MFMFIFIWLLFGIIAAMIGSRKGEAGLGFIFGILLGPLGILIMIFAQGNQRICPYCKEWVHKDATRCSHCQKEFTEADRKHEISKSLKERPSFIKGLIIPFSIIFFVAILVGILFNFLEK